MWHQHLSKLIEVTDSQGIARRFFVTNGFDGALTMIGLFMGFYLSDDATVAVAIKAGVGAAVALFMSGSTSAYISESAERAREIAELENAMSKDLSGSIHSQAARIIPFWVALVNGLSPLIISLLIMSPLWLNLAGITLPGNIFLWVIGLSGIAIFVLGLYLSTVSGQHWLVSGIKAILIAGTTLLVILLLDSI
ncbi:MAG: hypothetical protein R3208_09705 [Ketobacteraceae bacterium]|nr:hypothetical protein [Ketobacteraceae bacterium]